MKNDELRYDDFDIAEGMIKITITMFIVFCLGSLIYLILIS